jgi:hypothetical protein
MSILLAMGSFLLFPKEQARESPRSDSSDIGLPVSRPVKDGLSSPPCLNAVVSHHWVPKGTSVVVKGRKRWYNRRRGEAAEHHPLHADRRQLQRSEHAVGQVAAADRVDTWQIRRYTSS